MYFLTFSLVKALNKYFCLCQSVYFFHTFTKAQNVNTFATSDNEYRYQCSSIIFILSINSPPDLCFKPETSSLKLTWLEVLNHFVWSPEQKWGANHRAGLLAWALWLWRAAGHGTEVSWNQWHQNHPVSSPSGWKDKAADVTHLDFEPGRI